VQPRGAHLETEPLACPQLRRHDRSGGSLDGEGLAPSQPAGLRVPAHPGYIAATNRLVDDDAVVDEVVELEGVAVLVGDNFAR
jgi:hypothetical protein